VGGKEKHFKKKIQSLEFNFLFHQKDTEIFFFLKTTEKILNKKDNVFFFKIIEEDIKKKA
jgi:hypothetical protein